MSPAEIVNPQTGLLYLCACALQKTKADPQVISRMDLNQVYKLAKAQSLCALAWYGLDPAFVNLGDELSAMWSKRVSQSQFKSLMMKSEREAVCQFCNALGISHLLLKGILVEELYPAAGTREMSDNDILFDPQFASQIRDFFLSRGYDIEQYGQGNHDVYLKKPAFNFEMHKALFKNYSQFPVHAQITPAKYYENPFERAMKRSEDSFEYRLSDSDFYVYHTTHNYKHYAGAGLGVRNLTDCYVLKKRLNLDEAYIEKELEKLGIADYEKTLSALSLQLFQNPNRTIENLQSLNPDEDKMLKAHFAGGTYGSAHTLHRNQLQRLREGKGLSLKQAKIRYVMALIHPNRDHMKDWCRIKAPFFLKHEGLIWLSPIYRMMICAGSLTKRMETIRQIYEMKEAG